MDSAYISALAALAGSSIGGLATFATTWLNQSYQHKIQRHSNERARREKLFGDFMHEAASGYSDAMVNKLENSTSLVNLYSLKSRMSLFSGEDVLQEADKVLQIIIDRYFVDEIKYSNMSPSAVKNSTYCGTSRALAKRRSLDFKMAPRAGDSILGPLPRAPVANANVVVADKAVAYVSVDAFRACRSWV